MATCCGSLVRVEDVFEKGRREKGFGVPITETNERRHALRGIRPIDATDGNDFLRCDHVGASFHDGLREAFGVHPVGKKGSGARDR